jgi:hypothetical protein
MVDNELDGVLAARIARVTYAADLSEVASQDIDAFLDALEVDPFTDEQLDRILGRIGLSAPVGGSPVRPEAGERRGRFPGRRTARSPSGYRLSCEELENRLPPSVYGAALGGPGLHVGMTLATLPPGATVHLWETRHVMEVHGSANPWEEGRPPARLAALGTALHGAFPTCEQSEDDDSDNPSGDAAGFSWEALFCEMDVSAPASCELQLAG